MLKYNEANPLAVFGLRELEHCPLHFVQVTFDLKAHEKAISDWIWTNLGGRFWYGDWYSKDENNNVRGFIVRELYRWGQGFRELDDPVYLEDTRIITDPNLQVFQASNTVNVLSVGDWKVIPGTQTTQSSTSSSTSTSYNLGYAGWGWGWG